MSVCGIDLGGLWTLTAAAAKGGVDCILNESSNRNTAVCVGIQGKKRCMGDEASQSARSNIRQTFKVMKNLVGRNFDEPEVQAELARASFTGVKMEGGRIGVAVNYDDEDIVVPMEHILAMMLAKVNTIANEANNGVNIGDAVIAVPAWFTDAQRKGYASACKIAELNCLKLINESTAIALGYGIWKSAKKLFSETDPIHIMFIDIGYLSFTVSIADFIQEKLIMRSTRAERNVGGRNFDDIIVELMAAHFQSKTGIDVRNNKKAVLKLQVAAEKGKKQLSPNGVSEVNINVECLAEDMDLSYKLTKDVFEKACLPLIEKFEKPIVDCLAECGLSKSDIADVEVVGGTSRIGQVKLFLAKLMELKTDEVNNGLKTTMNADEAVARGAALQCAMESSRVKVKPFYIVDKLQYGIVVNTGEGTTATGESKDDEDADGANASTLVEIYKAGDDYPKPGRRITFKGKTSDFSFSAAYSTDSAERLAPGTDTTIANYTVKVPASYANSEGYDVRVTFTIDKAMCLSVTGAQLMEPLPVTEEETKGDESKGDESKGDEAKEGEAAAAPAKRKFKKVDLVVETTQFGMTQTDVKNSIELEAKMAHADKILTETANKRNDLESYIYAMRDRVDGDLKAYASESESSTLKTDIMSAEEWLYGDGFDATKKEYVEKIDMLRKTGDKLETRLYEDSNRKATCDQLRRVVDSNKQWCQNTDEAYAHITDEERDTVRTAASETESWLFDMLDKQGALGKSADPVLTVQLVQSKMKELFAKVNPIMTKPKPKPKEEPKPEEKKEDAKGTEGEEKAAEGGDDKNASESKEGDEVKEESTKMDVEDNVD